MFVPALLIKGAGEYFFGNFCGSPPLGDLDSDPGFEKNSITNYERPRLDRFVEAVNVGLDDLCFSYFGRFSAACFLIEVQTFEKSRTVPFFVKTSDYALGYIKLPVWTCITVAAGQKT